MAKAATASKKTVDVVSPSLKQIEFIAGDAKAAVKEIGAVSRTVYMVPIVHLHTFPRFNVRTTDTVEYKAGLQELADSIQSDGFYNTKPLSGFVGKLPDGKDGIFITDGHRRLEATKIARADGAEGLDKLPVILKPAATTNEQLTVALIRENAQTNLTMMEKAVAAKRLLGAGMAKAEVAKVFNCTERYIEDFLLLVNAPRAIRQLVIEGKLTGTLAVKELRNDQKTGVKEAETKLVAVAERKAGGEKVTSKDVNPAAVKDPEIKLTTTVVQYGLEKGQTAPYAEIQPIMNLFEDSDWFEMTEREGIIRATETFHVRALIKRPKKEEVVEADATPKKRGRPRKVDAPVGVEVDPNTMEDLGITESEEDDDEEAPDLTGLGIADPDDPAEGL